MNKRKEGWIDEENKRRIIRWMKEKKDEYMNKRK